MGVQRVDERAAECDVVRYDVDVIVLDDVVEYDVVVVLAGGVEEGVETQVTEKRLECEIRSVTATCE